MTKRLACRKLIWSILLVLVPQASFAGALYSYIKVVDQHTTYELVHPDYEQNAEMAQFLELCTIDGLTYVWAPDRAALPEQPPQVAATLKEIFPTPPPFIGNIIAASPFLQLTKKRMNEEVARVKYSERDEALLKSLGSLAVFPAAQFLEHIEKCRAWDKS